MRFFIIGNPSSVWLKEYIKHIHIKNNHKVYVTVFEMSDLKFVNEYREMGVQFVNLGEKGRGIKKSLNSFDYFSSHIEIETISLISLKFKVHHIMYKLL